MSQTTNRFLRTKNGSRKAIRHREPKCNNNWLTANASNHLQAIIRKLSQKLASLHRRESTAQAPSIAVIWTKLQRRADSQGALTTTSEGPGRLPGEPIFSEMWTGLPLTTPDSSKGPNQKTRRQARHLGRVEISARKGPIWDCPTLDSRTDARTNSRKSS